MTTKEMIKVMQSYERGEQIEYRIKNSMQDNKQLSMPQEPEWNWAKIEYRVKKSPAYRLYDNADEFLQAQKEHGPYLKYSSTKVDKMPSCVYEDSIEVKSEDNCGYTKGFMIPYATLFKYYLWQDGTPCGIKCE